VKTRYSRGVADLILLLGLGFLAIVLPIVSHLVTQNQDIRNRAAGTHVCAYVGSELICSEPTIKPTVVPTIFGLSTNTPRPIKSCSAISDATECAYTPYCRYTNGVCGNSPNVTPPTTNSNCQTAGTKRCVNGNAEQCNNINGSNYWQGEFCAKGCSNGACVATPTTVNPPPPPPTGITTTCHCSGNYMVGACNDTLAGSWCGIGPSPKPTAKPTGTICGLGTVGAPGCITAGPTKLPTIIPNPLYCACVNGRQTGSRCNVIGQACTTAIKCFGLGAWCASGCSYYVCGGGCYKTGTALTNVPGCTGLVTPTLRPPTVTPTLRPTLTPTMRPSPTPTVKLSPTPTLITCFASNRNCHNVDLSNVSSCVDGHGQAGTRTWTDIRTYCETTNGRTCGQCNDWIGDAPEAGAGTSCATSQQNSVSECIAKGCWCDGDAIGHVGVYLGSDCGTIWGTRCGLLDGMKCEYDRECGQRDNPGICEGGKCSVFLDY
jgi:hypothetical protein